MQKILIVEDDIDIQDILKNHLIDAGYEVAVASDGVAGIAMFDDTIDLLLLDIMLPKIDGYGVCEVIRKRSQVPIIMLTALSDALNAPVANSAQQKTVVSTTDDSDGVMSYKDKESGKTFVSEDNGASWMSEEDYNNSHPAINYEWWTYDEYKEWLEQEKKTLQEMADEHAMAETSEGSFEWTQEMTDQYIAEYEQTLEDIKNGLLVSKSVNGDDECMTTFNPNWVGSTTD